MRPLAIGAAGVVVVIATVALALELRSRALIVGVPAYGYPANGDMWARLLELASGSIVILNPANGPGDAVDPLYEKEVAELRHEGIKVYGYVDTAYGERPASDVLADARRFVEMYPLEGIFLDQTAVDADAFGYLNGITTALRDDDLEIALNPGQPEIDKRIPALADHIVTFEGDLPAYRATSFPKWPVGDGVGDQWHLVHGVATAEQMTDVIEQSHEMGVGAVFVTDRFMPNPWDGLPPYWSEELSLVGR